MKEDWSVDEPRFPKQTREETLQEIWEKGQNGYVILDYEDDEYIKVQQTKKYNLRDNNCYSAVQRMIKDYEPKMDADKTTNKPWSITAMLNFS